MGGPGDRLLADTKMARAAGFAIFHDVPVANGLKRTIVIEGTPLPRADELVPLDGKNRQIALLVCAGWHII